MRSNRDELERVVLQAVANDYEEFEMVVRDVRKWMGKVYDEPEIGQIEQVLQKSIVDDFVKAYECSETFCQVIATQANPPRSHSLLFYITEQGKERLRRLEEEEFGGHNT
jgi:hypothetical protein